MLNKKLLASVKKNAGLQKNSVVSKSVITQFRKHKTQMLRQNSKHNNKLLARKLLAGGFDLDIFDPAIDAEKLVGANLGYAYSRLPSIERILVSKETTGRTAYARVLAANATVNQLYLPAGADLRDLGTLP